MDSNIKEAMTLVVQYQYNIFKIKVKKTHEDITTLIKLQEEENIKINACKFITSLYSTTQRSSMPGFEQQLSQMKEQVSSCLKTQKAISVILMDEDSKFVAFLIALQKLRSNSLCFESVLDSIEIEIKQFKVEKESLSNSNVLIVGFLENMLD
jgi:hypothetical protein